MNKSSLMVQPTTWEDLWPCTFGQVHGPVLMATTAVQRFGSTRECIWGDALLLAPHATAPTRADRRGTTTWEVGRGEEGISGCIRAELQTPLMPVVQPRCQCVSTAPALSISFDGDGREGGGRQFNRPLSGCAENGLAKGLDPAGPKAEALRWSLSPDAQPWGVTMRCWNPVS